MLVDTFILVGLIISVLLILLLFLFVRRQQRQPKVKKPFMCILLCLFICSSGLILQILLTNKLHVNPIYFEYFVYIGTVFLPVSFFVMILNFTRPNNTVNIKSLIVKLSIIPVFCLLTLWTNDFHHLFYSKYSLILSQGEYGPFFYLTSGYTYLLLGIVLILLITYSIKNIRFYFMQALFIFIGILVPVTVNLLGVFGAIDMYIYMTPMYFTVTLLCFAISIFKFGFMKVSPVTLKNIVNRISDAYIVLNGNLDISDCNETLLHMFNIDNIDSIINKNLFNINGTFSDFNNISNKITVAAKETQNSHDTIVIEEYFKGIEKYFHIEINGIIEKNSFLGTLVLLKDITQHKIDMQTIRDNQDILVEKERLASLGQMIGGIAHNLKTPIMSISGATQGLTDLINEYSSSVGDSEVTNEDHLEIANDMRTWIEKIQTHLSYMSDVITTVKGQAVTFSDNASFTSFTIEDLIRQVNILMKHELNNALVTLEENVKVNKETVVKGNINSLVQVINNMISNAIQAYDGKTEEKIILSIYKDDISHLLISVQDFAGGLPDNVKNRLFKEMITTKGKNGTGLGLFMSYSNIKAHFDGDIVFETEKGKGTTFYIEIPI